ncbi:tetratricopeptide repeat protein [Chitinimonas lacunae]|uniref:Tetratricopeptide repeat protein n=1 Tax=Chitinimonas lacunae TaxID=1963018 RepID=A0ABV8MLQ5_9NEIS
MPISRLAPALLCLGLTVLPASADEARDVAELIGRGQSKAALERVDEALAKQPRDARLRFLRGVALAEQQRPVEAISVFVALTADHPTLPEPYNNLAVLYAQQGELDKARAALQQAIRTNPAYATAHANLADVYAKLAAQAYDRALQLDVAERRYAPPAAGTPAPTQPKLALVKELYTPVPGTPSVVAAVRPVTPPPAIPAKPPAPMVVASAPPSKPVPVPVPPAPTPPPPAVAAKPVPPPPTPVVAPPVSKPVAAAPAPVAAVPSTSKPVDATATKPQPPVKPDADRAAEVELTRAVNGWADAWSDQRVAAYLGYYGRAFKPPKGESRAAWEASRRERIAGAKRIEVKVQNVRVKLNGDEAEVRFVQRYRSDRLDSSTGKTLIFQKQGERWLIKEERVG